VMVVQLERDRCELFYIAADGTMRAVSVTSEPRFEYLAARALFHTPSQQVPDQIGDIGGRFPHRECDRERPVDARREPSLTMGIRPELRLAGAIPLTQLAARRSSKGHWDFFLCASKKSKI
jgi:hypothetical protein